MIAASPSAPATSGHGPCRIDAGARRGSRAPWRRRSTITDAIATDPNRPRLATIAGAESQRRQQRRRRDRRSRLPHRHVNDADHRTGDERGERDEHPHAAAAGGVERSRCAAAAELHADAEDERADDHRHANRRDRAAHQAAEHLAVGEQRQEDRARHREHQHLRAKAAAAAVRDQRAPRRGEAERGVIEDEAGARADEEQCRLSPGELEPEIQPRLPRSGRSRIGTGFRMRNARTWTTSG